MTLREFAELLGSIDAQARHHFAMDDELPVTIWSEYREGGLKADNVTVQGTWSIQVDRYTKDEYDEIAASITQTLDAHDCIAFRHLVEHDSDNGWIRHIWECEVIA